MTTNNEQGQRLATTQNAGPGDGTNHEPVGGDGSAAEYAVLPVAQVDPSPYQARQGFDDSSLASLAENMREVGLIEPILCRALNGRYQLVCGERRLRAARINGWETIASLVRHLTDKQARIICLSENLQREDLTQVEEIEGLAEYIDARMDEVDGYRALLSAALRGRETKGGPKVSVDLDKPLDRTAWFLSLCDSDRRTGTTRVSNTFIGNLDRAFSDLSRPVKWLSYLQNDLPIVRDIPKQVREVAVKHKLNKAQTKALKKAVEEAPEEAADLLSQEGNIMWDNEEGKNVLVPIEEMSAREILDVGRRKDHQLISQSLSNEWYTPKEYIEAARQVMGRIDLDPATSNHAQGWIQATEFYTADDDSLAHEWHGKVWMNPPWGDLTGKFVKKLDEEIKEGNVTEAVVLVNAHATDTDWFTPLWNGLLCFTDHRINYVSPYGEKESGSTHGSVFVYFGPNEDAFVRVFRQWGAIVRRVPDDD